MSLQFLIHRRLDHHSDDFVPVVALLAEGRPLILVVDFVLLLTYLANPIVLPYFLLLLPPYVDCLAFILVLQLFLCRLHYILV